MGHRTILLVENDELFRQAHAYLLRGEGYEILEAAALDDARHLLASQWVHLMIVDVRLVDDRDPEDYTGLWLVRGNTYPSIAKVVLSVYDRVHLERRVPSLMTDVPSDVTFLSKCIGWEALSELVHRLLDSAWPPTDHQAS